MTATPKTTLRDAKKRIRIKHRKAGFSVAWRHAGRLYVAVLATFEHARQVRGAIESGANPWPIVRRDDVVSGLYANLDACQHEIEELRHALNDARAMAATAAPAPTAIEAPRVAEHHAKGGRNAAARMTPEQRSARARKAVAARWNNHTPAAETREKLT